MKRIKAIFEQTPEIQPQIRTSILQTLAKLKTESPLSVNDEQRRVLKIFTEFFTDSP